MAIDADQKADYLARMYRVSSPPVSLNQCIGAYWLMDDGMMFKTNGHGMIGTQMKDLYSDYIISKTSIPMLDFMSTTNSIRVSCTGREMDVEFTHQQNPTSDQIQQIQQLFCDDGDKKRLLLEKTEHTNHQTAYLMKEDVNENEVCHPTVRQELTKLIQMKPKGSLT